MKKSFKEVAVNILYYSQLLVLTASSDGFNGSEDEIGGDWWNQ